MVGESMSTMSEESGPAFEPENDPVDDAEALPTPRRRRRWPWVVAVMLVVLVGAGAGAAYGVRTEQVAGALVDDAIGRLEHRLKMRITHGHIEPVGWTGVEVHDVAVYWDHDTETPWATVDVVRAYPDVMAALSGDVILLSLETEGAHAALEIDQDHSDLHRLRDALLEGRDAPAEPTAGAPAVEHHVLPRTIVMHRTRLQLADRQHRLADVEMESQELRVAARDISRSGQLHLSGDVVVKDLGAGQVDGDVDLASNAVRLGVSLVESTDFSSFVSVAGLSEILGRAKVHASGVEVAWPLALTLKDVRFDGLKHPWPWAIGYGHGEEAFVPDVESVKVGALSLSPEKSGPRILARDTTVWIGDREGPREIPLGDVRFKQDREQGTYEADVERRTPDGKATLHLEWDGRAEQITGAARLETFEFAPYARLMPAKAAPTALLESGHLSGTIAIDALLSDGIVDLNLDVTLAGGTLLAPPLAEETLNDTDLAIKGHLQIRRDPIRLQLREGRVRLGELEAELSGSLEAVEGGHLVKLELRSEQLDAGKLLASLPRGFAPRLDGYVLDGPYAFNLTFDLDTRKPEDLVMDGHLNLDKVKVVAYGPKANIPALRADDLAIHPSSLPARIVLGPRSEDWVPRREIPELLIQAITNAEDGRFFAHDGFDPRGIRSALVENIRQERFARGGSTISQQVIKNLFLSFERTLSRKFQEAVLTWAMEQTLSKDEIITLYLNMLHLGPDIYGLKEASRALFDKRPHRISLREAVYLGSILPNPDYFVRLYAQGKIPEDRRVKMRHILTNMHAIGLIGPKTFSANVRLTDDGIISISRVPVKLGSVVSPEPEEDPTMTALR